MRLVLLVVAVLVLTGCGSMARGVTEAMMAEARRPVVGRCEVEGRSFVGVGGYQRPGVPLKVLMVHGVGDYRQGYSDALAAGIARELGFGTRSRTSKQLQLMGPLTAAGTTLPGPVQQPLGELKVNHYQRRDGATLEVHELLWNRLTSHEKSLLTFDSSADLGRQRASLNRDFKQLLNAHIADPLIYLGPTGGAIRQSVAQALCLLRQQRWSQLAEEGSWQCPVDAKPNAAAEDPLVIVSHSLGSRIVIDALAEISGRAAADDSRLWRDQVVPVYMLSNQLQLLQLGRKAPAVVERRGQFCGPDATTPAERQLARLEIVAISDPNDLLSYSVPQPFIDRFIDSRLCPQLTNVSFTLTTPVELFGIGQLAMPMEAHKGYLDNPELITLLAHGLVASAGLNGMRPCRQLVLEEG